MYFEGVSESVGVSSQVTEIVKKKISMSDRVIYISLRIFFIFIAFDTFFYFLFMLVFYWIS